MSARAKPITREQAQAALSGNLCRCTGYRPILDAAQAMQTAAPCAVDEAKVLSKLELLAHIPRGLEADLSYDISHAPWPPCWQRARATPRPNWWPGCTDVGLWVTKQHRQFAQVLDVTRVAELRRVSRTRTTSPLAPPSR